MTTTKKEVNTWKLPGVDETPRGLLCPGESIPDEPPGGEGVLIDELLGILKLGRFLVKFWKKNGTQNVYIPDMYYNKHSQKNMSKHVSHYMFFTDVFTVYLLGQ